MFDTKCSQHPKNNSDPILSQTLFFFCVCVFFVFPLNWDRLGSHKIDQQIAQNLNFGEDFARNHCKTQCFCIIFCMKNISQEHPFCLFLGGVIVYLGSCWACHGVASGPRRSRHHEVRKAEHPSLLRRELQLVMLLAAMARAPLTGEVLQRYKDRNQPPEP